MYFETVFSVFSLFFITKGFNDSGRALIRLNKLRHLLPVEREKAGDGETDCLYLRNYSIPCEKGKFQENTRIQIEAERGYI